MRSGPRRRFQSDAAYTDIARGNRALTKTAGVSILVMEDEKRETYPEVTSIWGISPEPTPGRHD